VDAPEIASVAPVAGRDDLEARLAQVRWLGGGSGAGKTSVASRLAAERGYRLYQTDASIRPHLERSTPATHPLLHEFAAMTMDERWVDRPPAEMLATFHGFQGEGFEMIVDDLRGLPADQPVLAEGFRLLPRLVAPLLTGPRQAVWLLPTPAFRRRAFEARGTTSTMLSSTRDPGRALENLLERDRLFTDLLAAEAGDLHLQTIAVDIDTSVEDVAAMVRLALAI